MYERGVRKYHALVYKDADRATFFTDFTLAASEVLELPA